MLDYTTPTQAAINEAREQSIAEAERLLTEMLAASGDGASPLDALEGVGDLLHRVHGRYAFMRQVTTDPEVRAAAETCEEALDKYSIAIAFREDIYEAVRAFAATPEAAALTGEDQRLLDRMLRDYRRNGFDLPPEQRARVRELKERLVELDLKFSRNIDTWDDAILVTREDLAGLPDRYIDGLKKVEQDGQTLYRVSLDYPDFFPFMDYCPSEPLRRELQEKSYRKGGEENIRLLEEAIAVRDELARLLGYPSWAAYVIEERMAKQPEAVRDFLTDLRAKLRPVLERDLADLTALKREHTGDSNATLQLWDWRFYHNLAMRTRHQIDDFAVARYFPLQSALDGMFNVYQTLFGVRFVPIEAGTWHPDVRSYAIEEADTGEQIAYFFMDLFPRQDKFGHAAAFNLVAGRLLPDGSYQKPVSAIVANFTKPTETEPSLLRHGERGELDTLFHEFGHIVHQTLTRAQRLRFSGTRVERDFVEAPSQMLEHWVWRPEILQGFSKHVDTGEPLPNDLLERMLAAKHQDSGIIWCRQLLFAELDMAYHSGGVPDTTVTLRDLHPISGFEMPEDTYFQAGFGHLFGYDAGYYGYLWSKVYGDDMFTRFDQEGPLNEATGREYRRAILEPGGSEDGGVLVRRFLGREPTSDAFLRSLGL